MADATTFKAACVQLNSSEDPLANIKSAKDLVGRAAKAGAELIITPETSNLISPSPDYTLKTVVAERDDPSLAAYRDLASKHGLWLMPGSLAIKLSATQVANRSFLISPSGEITARYDKIHMFDVDIPDGQTYRESATYRPGAQAVLADLPWGKLGMSICYDMRFAALYRSLAKAGASFFSLPAAFTRFTGEAHWHVLLRARAIENGCFVFAAAQCGEHAGGRQTYGHSLIVAPWGEVLADAGEEPGIAMADIDVAKVQKAREMVPSLQNDRMFGLPSLMGSEEVREAGE